jgi:hypothetical protein
LCRMLSLLLQLCCCNVVWEYTLRMSRFWAAHFTRMGVCSPPPEPRGCTRSACSSRQAIWFWQIAACLWLLDPSVALRRQGVVDTAAGRAPTTARWSSCSARCARRTATCPAACAPRSSRWRTACRRCPPRPRRRWAAAPCWSSSCSQAHRPEAQRELLAPAPRPGPHVSNGFFGPGVQEPSGQTGKADVRQFFHAVGGGGGTAGWGAAGVGGVGRGGPRLSGRPALRLRPRAVGRRAGCRPRRCPCHRSCTTLLSVKRRTDAHEMGWMCSVSKAAGWICAGLSAVEEIHTLAALATWPIAWHCSMHSEDHYSVGVLAGPLDSPAAAHKAVRSMIAHALRDPYTKFISPKVTQPASMAVSVLVLQCSMMQKGACR